MVMSWFWRRWLNHVRCDELTCLLVCILFIDKTGRPEIRCFRDIDVPDAALTSLAYMVIWKHKIFTRSRFSPFKRITRFLDHFTFYSFTSTFSLSGIPIGTITLPHRSFLVQKCDPNLSLVQTVTSSFLIKINQTFFASQPPVKRSTSTFHVPDINFFPPWSRLCSGLWSIRSS